MIDARRAARTSLWAVILATVLVVLLDVLTNSIDTSRFSWDSRYYRDMAERGLGADLASPFAYRYLTPLLARAVSAPVHLPVENGFAIVAYVGAILQLLGVFLFTRWYTRSERGAWLAMLVTAFSLFNIKFLLFDTFRPDHLAYPLILLQTYFALSGRFGLLVASTIVGCQIREFNVIPLMAYLYACTRSLGAEPAVEARRKVATQVLISLISVGAALVLPRVFIPVTDDFQFASLSWPGFLRVLLAPFVLARDANFIFSIAAYLLPVLMLNLPGELRATAAGIDRRHRLFFVAYSALVLVFSFLGGTDFFRFSTYLLVPQAILLGTLADSRSRFHLAIVLASVFVFNRIWVPFPMSDVSAYLDLYGGYGTRFDWPSVLRVMECAAFVGIGMLVRKMTLPDKGHCPPAAS